MSEAVAALVCENLAALGLHIEAKRYGRFHEIRASTSREIVTEPGNQTASGIMLLLARAFDPPTLVFQEINAIERGLGRRMVAAAMAALRAHPGAFARVKVNDLSPFQKDGRRWWENVADDYGDLAWLITHESDTMVTRAAGDEAVNSATLGDQDITRSPHFLRMQDNLAAFARAFGYDAGKVSLSPKKKIFDYLGQRFVSEGEALPDGRIVIYYDPEMSDARLGCCVAHEIQHARYFALRDAHALEHGDGPLSRRFAHYTP
ncbi:MAG: hypothetical protein N2444_05410, partial [Methylocystis sp.]|nr:hypothetical protein [Methylocystis sp.]